MELRQALSLLCDLAEWEVENPAIQPPPHGWLEELGQAIRVTRECLDIQRVKRREVAHRAPYRHASVETMEKALEILMVNPGLSGSQLGRTLGKSVSNGRYIRAQLLPLLNSNGAGNGHLSKK